MFLADSIRRAFRCVDDLRQGSFLIFQRYVCWSLVFVLSSAFYVEIELLKIRVALLREYFCGRCSNFANHYIIDHLLIVLLIDAVCC